MLNYTNSDLPAKDIAIFYAKKINSQIAEEFFSGKGSLASAEEAIEVAIAFWAITDLASNDHLNDRSILNDVDLEFWMHKLFNKIYGYYERNGFKEQWQIVAQSNS